MVHQHGKHLQKDFAQKERDTCASFSKQNQTSLARLVLLSSESNSQEAGIRAVVLVCRTTESQTIERSRMSGVRLIFRSVWFAGPTDKLVYSTSYISFSSVVLLFNGRKKAGEWGQSNTYSAHGTTKKY